MQKQSLLRIGLLALLVLASLFLIQSTSVSRANAPSCCKKPRQTQDPGGMIWESLSRQFFSSVAIP
ncbi:MAG TPA: hypothetical protein VEB63_10980 [Chitinophagaceae bacterium]|nr:hypothetical protein [Chitinophagaceae bacterium]